LLNTVPRFLCDFTMKLLRYFYTQPKTVSAYLLDNLCEQIQNVRFKKIVHCNSLLLARTNMNQFVFKVPSLQVCCRISREQRCLKLYLHGTDFQFGGNQMFVCVYIINRSYLGICLLTNNWSCYLKIVAVQSLVRWFV
jgi:hypothetical protein